MNIIVFSRQQGRSLQIDLRSPRFLAAAAFVLVLLFGGVFAAGSFVGARWAAAEPGRQLERWSAELINQKRDLAAARQTLQPMLDALAMRVGQVNARVIRLDALGRRLTGMAHLNKGEFDFDSAPPEGGVDVKAPLGQAASAPVLSEMVDRLSAQINDRERQFGALEDVIQTRVLGLEMVPQGRPVESGFISSFFGRRVDPFTGYSAFHPGVDFAGPAGSEVVAVATGVVTWSGEHVGYGNLVEVNHGNGLVTRYAHNSKVLVHVGETVQKGQVVSLIGSTGHSTGPHLHFEVLRGGNPVDPMVFINENATSPLAAR
jgi:murein DD-endopeptidase MepM/ murein hydrolase activator NlpD